MQANGAEGEHHMEHLIYFDKELYSKLQNAPCPLPGAASRSGDI